MPHCRRACLENAGQIQIAAYPQFCIGQAGKSLHALFQTHLFCKADSGTDARFSTAYSCSGTIMRTGFFNLQVLKPRTRHFAGGRQKREARSALGPASQKTDYHAKPAFRRRYGCAVKVSEKNVFPTMSAYPNANAVYSTPASRSAGL